MKRILSAAVLMLMIVCAGIAEPEDKVYTFVAEQLPGYTFLDGCRFEETAMLLLEEEQGKVFFAGCARDGDEWTVTLSTSFPEWMYVALDTFHAGEGSMRLWTDRVPELREYEDELLDIYIDLQPDGTWRVYGVNNGWEVIEFRRQSIYEVCGYEFFGDVTIPLDITQVDWAMLPRSFHQAMALLDTSQWMLVAREYAPVYTADGSIGWYGAEGAAVQVLSVVDDMVQVRFIGRSDSGWMCASDLLPGSEQIARYDVWCEEVSLYGVRDIILEDDDPVVTWYDGPHDESTAAAFLVEHVEYVTVQGFCAESCCYLLYSETLDASGFVPIEQMTYPIE